MDCHLCQANYSYARIEVQWLSEYLSLDQLLRWDNNSVPVYYQIDMSRVTFLFFYSHLIFLHLDWCYLFPTLITFIAKPKLKRVTFFYLFILFVYCCESCMNFTTLIKIFIIFYFNYTYISCITVIIILKNW